MQFAPAITAAITKKKNKILFTHKHTPFALLFSARIQLCSTEKYNEMHGDYLNFHNQISFPAG